MRIAIDATPLMKPHRSGVGRYLVSLLSALAETDPDDEFLLCYRLSRRSRRRHRLALPGPRFRSCWMQGAYHPRGAAVTHGPDGRLLRWRGAASVVTVHDVFSLLTDEFASPKFREKKKRRYAEIADRADRILFVSRWTRDRFLDHHPISEDRYAVVPEGVGEQFRPEAARGAAEVTAALGIEGPHAVFVGILSKRKNVAGMLTAWEGMPADGPVLVLAGTPAGEHGDIEEEIRSRGLDGRVVITGFLSDDRLPSLIAGATCLLLPSFLEGFGLPALEAMACGTPLVASDGGALGETTGGIRVPVDPAEPDSIREGVLRLLGDDALRRDLRDRGLAWAARFSWGAVAERTLGIYREAAS